MIDFARINQAAVANCEAICCELFPNGRRNGSEFCIGSLAGEAGHSLQINLRKGLWMDFAGDQKGDMIKLWSLARNVTPGKAAKELDERLRAGGVTQQAGKAPARARTTPTDDWTALPHAPADARHRPRHFTYGLPAATWTYRTVDGHVAGVVCRFQFKDGSKDVIPYTWCRHKDGREGWRWKSMLAPRLLYGLPLLARWPARPVLVVEGEKTADAARRLLGGAAVVVTWAGGSKAIDRTCWTPLEGRKVSVWPDADEPGIKAAAWVKERLGKVRVITPPADAVPGWDLADAERDGWTGRRVTEWARGHIQP